jgi:hypothetical protein
MQTGDRSKSDPKTGSFQAYQLNHKLKVSKSRNQFMMSSTLPKNQRWDIFHYINHNLLSRLSDLYQIIPTLHVVGAITLKL